MKPVPGPVTLVARLAISPAGTLARWQFSQLTDVGKCALGPGPLVDGITTMLLTPKKLLLVTFGPWQVAHPEVIPLWLNAELLNLAPF
jgi:hypothetical protein